MSINSPPASASPADLASPLSDAVDSGPAPLTSTSTSSRHSTLSSPLSYASKNRLSQYSIAGSLPTRSRPQSHVFPMFPSSLAYTQVRDFAYPVMHPMHYGPPPEPSGPPSGLTTPMSESRRLSEPSVSWDQKMPWDSWAPDSFSRAHDLPPIQFGDGPPYSEDEDLQSPVVSTRHRKHKSTSSALHTQRGRTGRDHDRGSLISSSYDDSQSYYLGVGGGGSERYYVSHGGEANGPGGELVTYPPDQAHHSHAYQYSQQLGHGMESYDSDHSSSSSSPGGPGGDQSRYSRDYQFTITSPDEEFHGKAVALFDFERENENELPLVEGQIIWVSYRHGQGWLVAEDPKTQESGLVPEEYVRLLRDIEGGMNSLTGALIDTSGSPNDAGTPTQPEHGSQSGHTPTQSTSTNGYHQPVVSMFSTSSKDLNPYPTEQLGIQAGQAPPQVVHYHGQRGGSQMSTPTLNQLLESEAPRRASQDAETKPDSASGTAQDEPNEKPTDTQVPSETVVTER
ncbi:NAP1-binding protein 2 [Trichoderma ghanense]|uniref:NAP1-binding protein 2 n=1 Tax=Trichoderma ghanense TaxID=65468 RepID=A0ABY2GTU0_9HYPO